MEEKLEFWCFPKNLTTLGGLPPRSGILMPNKLFDFNVHSIGFLIMILMAAGSMIIVAILQKMPAPVRYVTSNLKPYTKKIEKNIDDTSGKSYRSEYPGQFSSKSGKMFYSKGENTDDLNWGGLRPVSEQASFKLGSIQRQVLQLPKSGVLFF